MPSHTPASALIKLFFIGGAPWKWPAWQDRTGVRYGLFPSDDEKLPPGITRKDAADIASYFRAYRKEKTEDDKIAFATKTRGSAAYPGRAKWNAFVSRNWSRWGVHGLIVAELKEWDIHPQDIVIREKMTGWPSADAYTAVILDTLGMKLFGEDAFYANSTSLPTDLRLLLRIFVQRSWTHIRVHVSNLKNRSEVIENAAREAFKELEEGKPTKAKVNKTIRAVAKWKECAELVNTAGAATAEEMLASLQEIMQNLGAKITSKKPVKSKGVFKVPVKELKKLASEEDVTDILNIYDEYFEMNVEEEDEQPILDALPAKDRGFIDEGGDFGVEVEANMQSLHLARALGFKTGLPPSFNLLRHRSGITPWDDEEVFKYAEHEIMPEYLDHLRLHWHQLAGAHSIIRSIFNKERDASHTMGVLIGDEVGLGKTAQSIVVIAFLNHLIYLQSREGRVDLPPVVAARPFFGGRSKVPSLPHLILCPGTLVAQWASELKTLFLPWSVDIGVYDSQTDGPWFWGPDGPPRTFKHAKHHRIIIATHSVVFNDFKKMHQIQKRKNARPWEIPSARRTLAGTIFGQDFLTITLDEAHHMRNPGNKHWAILRLLQQTRVRLIMTATPLHTAPKDVTSLERLVGIPHFFDEASYIEEKADASALRKAKKLDDDGETALQTQLGIIRRLRGYCIGHFLRRTTASLNWEGKELLSLPPYEEIIGLINLTERETAIMAERAEAAKATVMTACDSRIHTKKFYLEYRLAVGYAKGDAGELWPTFKSLEEWEPLKSTKMDVCAKICAHYLTHDDVGDVVFEEGQPIFPDIPDMREADIQRTRRIIIYAEFPSMAPLLQNVLQLYGVKSLAINGKISFDQRDKRVKELYSDRNPARVLIFSSVGSAGLNLAIADIVIFFDQPWSAQDERQIRGRAHRQPQEKVVKAIHLIANNTSDAVLYSVARGKANMFDAFVNKDVTDGLCPFRSYFLKLTDIP
ncbi:P-loop containing nucleoside triphosphate hydrolase protein [Macrolepiota fuliginosa MF-IS2]|uniref:P-loop containing nucleoside triphosphate hydrolase protein n=1 Tax=Macrolepiota fuliginosa MF-IS2 TaxID=1400762 RepID=A0A9P5X1W1_9AGAR|nr:P-loop containing nucleoside triphosphate hydrolase protein [Macrolepiota fuliginosa MF-IS2]